MSRSFTRAAGVFALALLVSASLVNAAAVGLNFASQEIQSADAAPNNERMLNTDLAGVIPTGFWNSLRNGSALTALPVSHPFPDPAGPVRDDSGAPTTVDVAWSSPGTFGMGGVPVGGHEKMMKSLLFSNQNAVPPYTISGTVTGIPYPLYDVYLYVPNDNSGRLMDVTVAGVTKYGSSLNDAGQINGDGAFTYTEIASTNPNARDTGDYVHFPGLSLSSFTFSVFNLNEQNGAMAGIQIIAIPEPTSACLLAMGAGVALMRRRRVAH